MDVRVRLNAETEGYAAWKATAVVLAASGEPPLSPGMVQMLSPAGDGLAGEQGMVVPQGDVEVLRADSLRIQAAAAGGSPVLDPLLEEPLHQDAQDHDSQDRIEFVIRVPRHARRVTVDIEE
jgi:hypothetical protein